MGGQTIVERLRALLASCSMLASCSNSECGVCEVATEAADTIEALAASLEGLLKLVDRSDVASWLVTEHPAEWANIGDAVGNAREAIAKTSTDNYVVSGKVYESAVKGRQDFRAAYQKLLPVLRAAEAISALWRAKGRKVDVTEFWDAINAIDVAVTGGGAKPDPEHLIAKSQASGEGGL